MHGLLTAFAHFQLHIIFCVWSAVSPPFPFKGNSLTYVSYIIERIHLSVFLHPEMAAHSYYKFSVKLVAKSCVYLPIICEFFSAILFCTTYCIFCVIEYWCKVMHAHCQVKSSTCLLLAQFICHGWCCYLNLWGQNLFFIVHVIEIKFFLPQHF
jgi:hypothetical protein